jgi:hypothetical protein
VNTIYELYSSDGLTRETIGTRGRNVSQGGGVANFFAQSKIKFSGRSEMNFGARSVSPNAAALFLPLRKKQGEHTHGNH